MSTEKNYKNKWNFFYYFYYYKTKWRTVYSQYFMVLYEGGSGGRLLKIKGNVEVRNKKNGKTMTATKPIIVNIIASPHKRTKFVFYF